MKPLDLTSLEAALAANELTVLSAPPGTGKTTRVPLALLHAPWLQGKKILVLEPRRLAARRAAQYMALLLDEPPGKTIGWQVRLERCIGPTTRVEFLTEGLLARRLLDDPELADVGLIIFDEFHERSLALDVAFALAREIREHLREDLRLLIMSATIDEKLLPGARFLSLPAEAYPVTIEHLGAITPEAAILRALRQTEGSILCFLPGEGEIKSLAQTLLDSNLPPDVRIAPLYAALDKRDQDSAVAPPPPGLRKIVLATSIAESSLTIEGISVVVDTGLARVPKFSSRNGLTRLVTQRIPLDRAIQRTGRAGRLRAGHCYRLWSEGEEVTFAKTSQPEILDTDLTQVALMCAEWGSEFQWLTPPPPTAWTKAKATLKDLKAVDDSGRLTPLGHDMVRFPIHPALAAMMLRMQTIDPAGGALLAAICSEGEKIAALRSLTDFRRVIEVVLQTRPRELWRLAERWARTSPVPKLSVDELAPYLLWAYPGHLAKARDNHTGRYLLAAGFGAVLPQGSPLMACPWLLAIRMSDGEGEALIRWALPLDESDLAHCTPTLRTRIEWDKVNARLIAAEETCFGAIVYKQRPLKTIPPEAQAMAMRARLEHQGLPWTRNDEHLVQRCRFLHQTLPEEGWPAITDDDLIDQLVQAPSMTLRQAIQILLSIAGHTLMDVDAQAPARLLVPSGSHLLVHYDQTTPYIEVKIQEVFGLKATPRIACAKVAIVFHLLSPAQRPVQVTSDLESFWSTGYALVRKDLRGRYPKHYWPEDPTQAIATARTVLKPPRKT